MKASGQLHAPAALPLGKRAPNTHWIGGWVGLRVTLDAVVKRKIPSPSVCVGNGYGLDVRGSGVRFPVGLGIFLFSTACRPALGSTQPSIQWVPGALSLGLKRPEREAHNSHPCSVKVKNPWSYTSTPPYLVMTWCLIKQRLHLPGVVLS
jgi:hypothetical protein